MLRSLIFFSWRYIRTRIRVFFKGMYHYSYYPRPIFEKYQLIESINNLNPEIWNFIDVKLSDHPDEIKINCAGKIINIEQLPLFWQKVSIGDVDPEVLNSSHRFHWLLEKLNQGVNHNQIIKMVDMIIEWNNQFNSQNYGPAWQPYNVSERICNWIVFWQLTTKKNIPLKNDFFTKTLQTHAVFLSNNLEYPASDIVNNHLLNNARALYISGRFLNNKSISNLGIEIFKFHLPEMVGKGGYLKESSSHYQLLITRSVLEVQKVALESNDEEFASWLKINSEKMLAACQNLLPLNLKSIIDMPRIGDISPDMPFNWFSPINKFNAGWNNLWKIPVEDQIFKNDLNDGWVNIGNKSWFAIVFSHSHSDSLIYPSGHGHDDFGSFCLYLSGLPVIVDVGQLNYKFSSKSQKKGATAEMHNTVLIDNKSLLPLNGRFFNNVKAFRKAACNKVDDQLIEWSLVSRSGSFWSRKLSISSLDEVILKDSYINAKVSKGSFNFSPQARVKIQAKNQIAVSIGDTNLIIKLDGVDKIWIEKSTFYNHYGVPVRSKKLNWTIYMDNNLSETTISFLKNSNIS